MQVLKTEGLNIKSNSRFKAQAIPQGGHYQTDWREN